MQGSCSCADIPDSQEVAYGQVRKAGGQRAFDLNSYETPEIMALRDMWFCHTKQAFTISAVCIGTSCEAQ
jgi:hypothetical protein